MKSLASMHENGPGLPSRAFGMGRCPPRSKWASAGLLAAAAGGGDADRDGLRESPAIAYPDPVLTPGSIRSTDRDEICSTDTRGLRHGSRARSDLVYGRYGIARSDRMQFTLDHLVPLEIGGADVIENLWPEPRRSLAGEWDDTRKDQLERRLAILVCAGQLDVREAQRAVAEDWTAAFVKYVAEPSIEKAAPPLASPSATALPRWRSALEQLRRRW